VLPVCPAANITSASFSPAWSRRDDPVNCISPDPANTITDRLNIALSSSGPGFVLRLCPNAHYMIQAPILFAAPDQEISTVGYPTDDSRATLVVDGPVANGTGHTIAVDGTCPNCSGIKLRNIQVSALTFCFEPFVYPFRSTGPVLAQLQISVEQTSKWAARIRTN
jgi:hypothetical protein